MPELDKWQQREVARHAAENGLSEEEAYAALYPEPEASAAEPESSGDEAPAAGADTKKKASLTK